MKCKLGNTNALISGISGEDKKPVHSIGYRGSGATAGSRKKAMHAAASK